MICTILQPTEHETYSIIKEQKIDPTCQQIFQHIANPTTIQLPAPYRHRLGQSKAKIINYKDILVYTKGKTKKIIVPLKLRLFVLLAFHDHELSVIQEQIEPIYGYY